MTDVSSSTDPPNPVVSIWTRPRATIRYLVENDPTRHVLQLAMAGGVGQSLSQAMESGMGDTMELPNILLLSSVIGSLFGLAALYGGAMLISWTARPLGGHGARAHLRTAIAWSYVPWVGILLLSGVVFALIGRLPFLSEAGLQEVGVTPGEAIVMACYGLSVLALGVWSFVILLKSIGEVQGFSAWKAWGNLLLAGLPVVLVGILAALLVPALTS